MNTEPPSKYKHQSPTGTSDLHGLVAVRCGVNDVDEAWAWHLALHTKVLMVDWRVRVRSIGEGEQLDAKAITSPLMKITWYDKMATQIISLNFYWPVLPAGDRAPFRRG